MFVPQVPTDPPTDPPADTPVGRAALLSDLNLRAFARRCFEAALAGFPANAGVWQSFAETHTGLRGQLQWPVTTQQETTTGAPATAATGLAQMLPQGMAAPTAIPARNALRMVGTEEQIEKLQEVIQLLDRPAREVVLRVELLQLEEEDLEKLGPDWQQPDGETVRFARGKLPEFAQAVRAGASLVVRNNTLAELSVGEVLPANLAEDDRKDAVRIYGRFLRFRLVPRVNADDSVTITFQSDYMNREVLGGMESTEVSQLLTSQVRAGNGDTVLFGLGKVQDDSPLLQGWSGPGRLAEPVLAITPSVIQ